MSINNHIRFKCPYPLYITIAMNRIFVINNIL